MGEILLYGADLGGLWPRRIPMRPDQRPMQSCTKKLTTGAEAQLSNGKTESGWCLRCSVPADGNCGAAGIQPYGCLQPHSQRLRLSTSCVVTLSLKDKGPGIGYQHWGESRITRMHWHHIGHIGRRRRFAQVVAVDSIAPLASKG
jgi:hypothetical protein